MAAQAQVAADRAAMPPPPPKAGQPPPLQHAQQAQQAQQQIPLAAALQRRLNCSLAGTLRWFGLPPPVLCATLCVTCFLTGST